MHELVLVRHVHSEDITVALARIGYFRTGSRALWESVGKPVVDYLLLFAGSDPVPQDASVAVEVSKVGVAYGADGRLEGGNLDVVTLPNHTWQIVTAGSGAKSGDASSPYGTQLAESTLSHLMVRALPGGDLRVAIG